MFLTGDFNGDGRQDILEVKKAEGATVTEQRCTISLYISQGNSVAAANVAATPAHPGNDLRYQACHWVAAPFSPGAESYSRTPNYGVIVRDFDGDKRADFAVYANHHLKVYMNRATSATDFAFEVDEI